jgi:uncharacterized protein YbjT (DUF2867 family)
MILVLGATGTVGRLLVRQLVARGAPARAFVRSEARGRELGVPFVVGDLDDEASLARALEGARRVFLNGPAGPQMASQQAAVVDLAKRAGVERIVKLSTRGAAATAEVAAARAHAAVEERLRASGVPFAVLRPAFFMQNFLRHAESIRSESRFYGAYRDGRIAFLDAEDIARAAASLLTREDHADATFILTGPEALTHAEVARLFTKRLEREITYVDLPVEQIVAHMTSEGVPEAFARGLGVMMSSMANGAAAELSPDVERITGQPPRSFDEFLADHVAAFR